MAQDFKICRLCLSKTKIFFDLNEDRHSSILESITAIKLDPLNSSEPSVMCLKCRLNLRLAYAIQQNIIKSHREFENILRPLHLQSVVYIKQEPDSNCDYPEPIIVKTEPVESGRKSRAPISCCICHKKFTLKSSLQTHYRRKHPGDQYKSFKCDSCTRSFRCAATLEAHFNTSHKKKSCPVCKKKFLAANYERHLETHNPTMGRLICHFCGNSAKSKDSLRVHVRVYHLNKQKIYKCENEGCDKKFKRKRDLVSHENSIHGGGPTEICEICGKKFLSVETLRVHKIRVHLKFKKYTCEFCKKNFSSPYALTTHRRQHTNETPFRCDVCAEGFRKKASLKCHMSSKHNIKEEKNVECGVCGKMFASDHALITHKRVHVKDSSGD